MHRRHGQAQKQTVHHVSIDLYLESADKRLAYFRQILLAEQSPCDAASHEPARQLPELVEDARGLFLRCPWQDSVVKLLPGVCCRRLHSVAGNETKATTT